MTAPQTAPIRIRRLRAGEIPQLAGMAPPEWNSDLPALFAAHFGQPYFQSFVAAAAGRIGGVGQAVHHGDAGWLGNIIVRPDWRGRGLGRRLTQRLMAWLEERGCRHQLLVATAMGEPVYRRLGFVECGRYLFFKGPPLPPAAAPGVRPARADDREAILAIDRRASGEERGRFLARHLEGARVHESAGAVDGFYLPAYGAGLVVASGEKAGRHLLAVKHAGAERLAVVPEANCAARRFLAENGFCEFLAAPRMCRGGDVPWQPEWIYARGSGWSG